MAVFDEHRPVGDVPHADLHGGEVRCGVPQQEEGVEVGRGQLHGGAVDLGLFGRLLAGAALQLLFNGAVGEVGVDVQKVEVVFDQDAVEGEGRVVVDILVYLHLPLAAQQLVGLLLAAVEPDVDVAARPVLGPRVGEAQSVPLEKHHRNAVAVHEGCQAADHATLPGVELFDALDVEGPLQADRARRHRLVGEEPLRVQRLQPVADDGRDALCGGQAAERRPRIARRERDRSGRPVGMQPGAQQREEEFVDGGQDTPAALIGCHTSVRSSVRTRRR